MCLDLIQCYHFFHAASIHHGSIFSALGGHIRVRDGWLGMCKWKKEK